MIFDSCMILVLAAGLGKMFLKKSGEVNDLKMIKLWLSIVYCISRLNLFLI